MAVLAFQVFLRKDAAHPLGVLSRHGYGEYGLAAALLTLVSILVSSVATHGHGAVLAYVRGGKRALRTIYKG